MQVNSNANDSDTCRSIVMPMIVTHVGQIVMPMIVTHAGQIVVLMMMTHVGNIVNSPHQYVNQQDGHQRQRVPS